MSTATIEPPASDAPAPPPRRKFNAAAVTHTLDRLGLGFFSPFVRLAVGDEPAKQGTEIVRNIVFPLMAFAVFVGLWTYASQTIHTDAQRIPSPSETWTAWKGIVEFARGEDRKAAEFRTRMKTLAGKQEEQAAKFATEAKAAKAAGDAAGAAAFDEKGRAAKDRAKSLVARKYAGPPTFFTQIRISLITIAVGFLAATVIAVPIGILCGINKGFNVAFNPLIQIFKPVSPLAWLPIVFVVVTALYDPSPDSTVSRAMLISAGTVTLCSLWPTLINTAVGVAGIDPDHMNVARVLKLNWWQKITKIILPSALPYMFTGMRLSLGVGWMVLIAADMLAQNPGLGKFVWDTFQNGSTSSMAQIVCAVFAIGIIGFFLDRIMLVLQRLASFEDQAI
jgi:nitrate/nitrite transport system permease protein